MPMDPATLDGIAGYGELKVVRSADDHVEEIAGLWRQADEADPAALHALHGRGSVLVYSGRITDPLYPDVHETELEVSVTGVERYTYDDGDGATREVAQLKASGALGYEATATRAKPVEATTVIDDMG